MPLNASPWEPKKSFYAISKFYNETSHKDITQEQVWQQADGITIGNRSVSGVVSYWNSIVL